MPYRIITKLKALEAMDIPTQIGTENPYLNQGLNSLPEEAMDLIDAAVDDCCRIFGTRTRPTAVQLRIMAENGYQMSFDGPKIGVVAQATAIHTSKGIILYK